MNKVKQSEKEKLVDNILNRGIIKQILPSAEEFKKRLLSDKPMNFYIGADTTGNSLHLSHAKNFMLLEEFRQLGHKVFVLFGDFTATIGDPSDKLSARSQLTREMAKQNALSWVDQIKSIINFEDKTNPAEVVFNSKWLDQLSSQDLMQLFSNLTVQQLLERDMFEKRMIENKPIFVNEFLYPFFQGYDSVAMNIDVELCGTDQIFNALTGREFVKRYLNKEKFVVAVNLMENPKTNELMSKSNNTGVFLGTSANDMFGQIMAQPDEMIEVILINNTRISLEDIKKLDIENNPMEAKLFTAEEVVRIFHGEEQSKHAKEAFVSSFSKREFPQDAPVVEVEGGEIELRELIYLCKPDTSKSNIRRLIAQNAVSINGEKFSNDLELIKLNDNEHLEIKVGKRDFFKVVKK